MSDRSATVPDDSLQVSDHTKIVEFVLGNYKELSDMNESTPMTAVQILEACAGLARESGQSDPQLFSRAAVGVHDLDEFLARNEVPDSVWQSAVPVIIKTIQANSNEERIGLLELESRRQVYDASLQTGFEVAKDILIDGADTIYSPETEIQVVYQVMDPRQLLGGLTALKDQISGALGAVKDVAVADGAGAVAGAVVGGIKGGIAGAAAGGPGVAAGALAGAAKDAVYGAIGASVSSAVKK